MSLAAHYWRNRFASWPKRPASQEGYTLILTVPGDLPVMLEIALATVRHQTSERRISTVIVPDRPTKEISQLHAAAQADWSGPLELVHLPKPEYWLLPALNNSWRNHGIQMVTGVAAARSSHIILHDADLFLMNDEFLDHHFLECQQRDLACLGVQVAWDHFYADHGRELAATWELCASVDWMRAWPPAMHLSHEGWLWEEKHSFDSTLLPQALTDAHRVAINGGHDGGFVHFGHVTTVYRLWQKRTEPVVDGGFTHLLIRTMIDVFSSVPEAHRFPSFAELTRGLTDPSAAIYYPPVESGREDFLQWRTKLTRALSGPWTSEAQRERASRLLEPFDRFYLDAPVPAV